MGGGAAYARASGFHGWGGSARFGYFFSGNNAIELEINYFDQKAHSNKETLTTVDLGASSVITRREYARTAKLEQFPLMLNYRYHGTFADFICSDSCWTKCMLYYLGGGVGINLLARKIN